jgi:hypothetical protein
MAAKNAGIGDITWRVRVCVEWEGDEVETLRSNFDAPQPPSAPA